MSGLEVSALGSVPACGVQSLLEEGADVCVLVGVVFGSPRLSAPEAASTVGSCCVLCLVGSLAELFVLLIMEFRRIMASMS